MIDSPAQDEPLTAQGHARRDAMLGELLTSMHVLHHRRRAQRRLVAGAAVMVLVSGLALMFAMPRDLINDRPKLAARPQPPDPSLAPHSTIEYVHTDPTLLQRWQGSATTIVEIIDDRMLLAALDEMNRPCGLIRAEGRVWLTRDVVDPSRGQGS